MSYKVLALKWRPRLFKDAVGQESIAKTLQNSIKNDKIAHAYLLTGTRGIGKTTFARIFAKAIMCENRKPDGEPCLECNSCLGVDSGQSLDYIEIDGASNNSVDDIRDLKENVQYLPANGRYKVYIIDEVHMLTVNAFNALLKTLEEPPAHVVFIFATTDPHKLLGTVLSRCMRFDFKNATLTDLESHLNKIATAEGYTFESEYVAKEIAKQSKGSFRDSLSLLDQVINLSEGTNITESALHHSLGMADSSIISKFLSYVFNKDKDALIKTYEQVLSDNIDYKKFAEQVLNKLGDIIFSLNNNHELPGDFTDVNLVKGMPVVELMWIYETMYRDLEWSFNTFEPEKATKFVFIKIAQRELLLQKSNVLVEQSADTKKKLITSEPEPAPVTVTEEAAPIGPVEKPTPVKEEVSEEEPTWTNFLKFLYAANRAMALNLEHGNMINQEDFGHMDCVYEIGFSSESKIFYDYLTELDNSYKLKELICSYLEFDISQVEINLKLINNENKEFLSNAQLTEKNQLESEQEQREKILNNKYIKSAEELFHSEIKQVVLNKSEN